MNTNFALICIRCFEKDAEIVDDCCVHIVGESMLLFRCHRCGHEEYMDEKIGKEDLVAEKKKIEKQLKKLSN